MFKNIRMLFKLRSWLKSGTLQAGGVVGLLAGAQTFIETDDGMRWLDLAANVIGITSQTASGLALGLVGLIMLILRAKTEWSLDEKAEGKHEGGFSSVPFVLTLFALACVAMLAASVASAEVKTFSYDEPTTYTDGSPLPIADFDYRLECGNVPGSSSLTETWAAGPLSRQVDIPPGVWYCILRAVTNSGAQYPGRVSMPSNEVNFTVPADPTAPANLSVS